MCDYWVLEINVINKLDFKKQSHYFANKGPASQNYGFSSNHVLMWELDYKESWAPENWCFWIVVMEKTLESPLDSKEIQPVHPKGNQFWISMEGLMLKLKLQYFSHLMQELTHLKRPWCWERFKVWGEGVDRGWDGWMASPTQWTWVLVNSFLELEKLSFGVMATIWRTSYHDVTR